MGVNFCGYRIFTTHKLLRVASKKKIKKNVKKWNRLYNKKQLNLTYSIQSLNSWIGHSSHSNSYKLQQKILKECEFIYNENSYKKIEQNTIYDIINYKNIAD